MNSLNEAVEALFTIVIAILIIATMVNYLPGVLS